MPGIAGLITNKPRQEAEPELQRMISALRHEDFYETGTWVDQSLGVYVGWVARTGSSSDGMPMRNARTDVVLIFSGEDFSETETGGGLKEGNGAMAIRASYLVRAYEENSSFPAGLNGRFHGLVMNRERGTAMLFNDRYGMHRIYYHESPEGFYFAAEAKAILAVRPELRNADSQALGEFVTYGCVLENRTLFRALRVLPAASAWVFRNGLIESKASYFHPREWEEQARLDPENYYQELRSTAPRGGSPTGGRVAGRGTRDHGSRPATVITQGRAGSPRTRRACGESRRRRGPARRWRVPAASPGDTRWGGISLAFFPLR